jgi:antitoxin component of MazEF toxin-antitoxin module
MNGVVSVYLISLTCWVTLTPCRYFEDITVKTRAKKWRNSLVVFLSRSVAQRAGIRPGDEVEIQVDNGCVILVPTKTTAPKYRLRDLLNRVTKKNIHRETGWGKPRGKEV